MSENQIAMCECGHEFPLPEGWFYKVELPETILDILTKYLKIKWKHTCPECGGRKIVVKEMVEDAYVPKMRGRGFEGAILQKLTGSTRSDSKMSQLRLDEHVQGEDEE